MSFTNENIFFLILSLMASSITRSLVTTLMMLFLQLELHTSPPRGTFKIVTTDFVLELEQPKIEQLAPTTAKNDLG